MIDMGTSPPRVRNTNRGEAMIVNHREYLGELVTGAGTPTAFTLQTYAINPGNSTLFPFCARLAQNFQEWEIRGMLLELKSEASNTATSLSLGSMFAAVDYNSLDAAPVSKVELENMEYACSNKPTDSIIMPIECARKNDVLTHLYIANDSDYLTGDKRLYDLGNLFVGSYGCPVANSPIAEIWITYEIALFKPHIHVPVPPPEPFTQIYAHLYGSTTDNTRPLAGALGGNPRISATDNGITVVCNDLTTPRYFLINMFWRTQGTITAPKPPTTNVQGSPVVGDGAVSPTAWSGIAGNFSQTYAFTPASTLISADSLSYSFLTTIQPGNDLQISLYTDGSVVASPQTTYWDCYITWD